MDLFRNAKAVRLKSAHDKYLTADEDEESVTQDRSGSSKSARWTVEFVDKSDTCVVRLKSCYGKYLTASNQPFLLGMTGRKVLQTLPGRLDSSLEWEAVIDNGGKSAVKLKTRYGQYLRANGGLPPWRNSVTHDVPRTFTQDVVWEVHVVDIVVGRAPAKKAPVKVVPEKKAPAKVVVGEDEGSSFGSESSSLTSNVPSSNYASFSRQESIDSLVSSPPKGNDGRLIHYRIADVNGEIDEGFEELCITFKGNGVQELTGTLEGELGIQGITVCTRSPLNGKLYPLRLQLPPNNAPFHVVVVPPSSQEGQDSTNTGMPS